MAGRKWLRSKYGEEKIRSGYSELELDEVADIYKDKAIHRGFLACFGVT
jgi:hypothetical protein